MSFWELVVVGVVALLVLGPEKLPGAIRSVTGTIRSIRQFGHQMKSELSPTEDRGTIIINGGTTTFQMVHFMSARRLQVMTNSFAIAEHLVKHSKCNVSVPGGAIYRDQSLILSPFENDAIRNFYARRMFIGAQGSLKARQRLLSELQVQGVSAEHIEKLCPTFGLIGSCRDPRTLAVSVLAHVLSLAGPAVQAVLGAH